MNGGIEAVRFEGLNIIYNSYQLQYTFGPIVIVLFFARFC